MSFSDPAGPVMPGDAGRHARMVRHDLLTLGFRLRRRPRHVGLAVLVGLLGLIVLVFVYSALFVPAEQEPGDPGSRLATIVAED